MAQYSLDIHERGSPAQTCHIADCEGVPSTFETCLGDYEWKHDYLTSWKWTVPYFDDCSEHVNQQVNLLEKCEDNDPGMKCVWYP
jgi:hypothetical protein